MLGIISEVVVDIVAQETSIIVVIIEVTHILEVVLTNRVTPTVVIVLYVSHVLLVEEYVLKNKELRVIEDTI